MSEIWHVMDAIRGWRWGLDGRLERWPPTPKQVEETPADGEEAAE